MSSERLTMNDVLDKVILREFLDMTHMFLAPLTQQVNIVMLWKSIVIKHLMLQRLPPIKHSSIYLAIYCLIRFYATGMIINNDSFQ